MSRVGDDVLRCAESAVLLQVKYDRIVNCRPRLPGHRSPEQSVEGYEGTNNSEIIHLLCKFLGMTINHLEEWLFISAGVWHRNVQTRSCVGGSPG